MELSRPVVVGEDVMANTALFQHTSLYGLPQHRTAQGEGSGVDEDFSVYGPQPGDNSKSEPVPGITGVHILIGRNYRRRPLPGGLRFQPRRQGPVSFISFSTRSSNEGRLESMV